LAIVTGFGPPPAERETRTRDRLVDLAVTIIVGQIALLGPGLTRTAIHPATRLADGHAHPAHRLALLAEGLVHQSIAIIVEVITCLGGRRPHITAHEFTVDAAVETHSADPDAISHHPFVEPTIAIVVHAVAGLLNGDRGITNTENPVHTLLDAFPT